MRIQRPSGRSAALFGAAATGITCAAASPAAMLIMDQWMRLDWSRLSNIGQAYGLASAIFSVLAVMGVAVSLAHQRHGIVVQRDQDMSDAHSRLLALVLSDPETFGPMLSDKAQIMGATEYKRYLFVTLVLRLTLSGYETGHTNEYSLRNEVFRGIFRRSVGRDHWRESRTFWLSASLPSHRRFAQMADEEYRAAIAGGPPAPVLPEKVPPPPRTPLRAALAAGVLGGLVGAAAMAAAYRRPPAAGVRPRTGPRSPFTPCPTSRIPDGDAHQARVAAQAGR